jgi:cytolysin (calcineurin-like family phosphatase)
LNRNSVTSINKLKDQFGDKLKFIIINGDLTEYGHDHERAKFNFIYSGLKLPAYQGLGNHDYANHVGDCWSIDIFYWMMNGNNACASRMLNYVEEKVREIKPVRFDFKYYTSGWFGTNIYREGSRSYSWEVGNVHFVQLHNYPSYKKSWKFNLIGNTYYYINPSFDWLENDLKAAKYNNNPLIIINLHDPFDHWDNEAKARFNSKYKNSLIFVSWKHIKLVEIVKEIYFKDKSNSSKIIPNWPSSDYDSIYIIKISRENEYQNISFSLYKQELEN